MGEEPSRKNEEKEHYPATCNFNVKRFIWRSLGPYEPVDVWQVERSVQHLCPFRQILFRSPTTPLPDTNITTNPGTDPIGRFQGALKI